MRTKVESIKDLDSREIAHLKYEEKFLRSLGNSSEEEKRAKLNDNYFYFKFVNYPEIMTLIRTYNAYLTPENKIRIALNISDRKTLENFITLNYTEIKDFLKTNILINQVFISKEEQDLLFKKTGKRFFSVPIFDEVSKNATAYLYHQFKDYIIYPDIPELLRITENGSIFTTFDTPTLLEFFKDKESPNYLNILNLVSVRLKRFDDYKIEDEVLIEALLELYKHNFVFDIVLAGEEKRLRLFLTPKFSDFNKIDKNYLETLKALKNLPRKERKNNSLYKKAFNIFLNTFKTNYQDTLDTNECYLLEQLFNRIINGLSLFLVLSINNAKTLYHFYKTNEFLEENAFDCSLEEVKNYNAKQYLKLVESIYGYNFNNEYLPFSFNEILRGPTLFNFFIFYGFDFLYRFKDKFITFFFLFKYGIAETRNDSEFQKLFLRLMPELMELEPTEANKILKVLKNIYLNNKNLKNKTTISVDYLIRIINNCEFLMLPNNKHLESSLDKLNLIKKGQPLEEKFSALKLYNNYRDRLYSSIPDIIGNIKCFNYMMVPIHSEEILTNGIDAYVLPKGINVSCLTPNGKASSSLRHGAISPHGRFFKVTYKGQLLCYSWVWRAGEVLAFDNIEVTKYLLQIPNYQKLIYDIYYEASKKLVEITHDNEETGINLVVIGRTPKDVALASLDALEDTRAYGLEPFKPNDNENLYLEDSKDKQVIIYKNCLPKSTDDVTPIYQVKRKEVSYFDTLTEDILAKLKSIYFDYALEHCERSNKYFDYVKGYIGEDWFLGINKDGSKEFFYHENDPRLFEEARNYGWIPPKVSLIKSPNAKILDIINGDIKLSSDFKDYLNSLKNTFTLPPFYSFHSVSFNTRDSLEAIMNILKDGAIGSGFSRRIPKGGWHNGSNGYYFISTTTNKEALFNTMKVGDGFILSPDILSFKAFDETSISGVADEKYPLLRRGDTGEYQVFRAIPYNKFLALQLNIKPEIFAEIAKIAHIMAILEYEFPLINKDNQIIDPKEVMKLSRIKK